MPRKTRARDALFPELAGSFELVYTFAKGPDLPPRCHRERVAGKRAEREAHGEKKEGRENPNPRRAFKGYVVAHFTHLSGATSTAQIVVHSAIVSGLSGQV